MQYPLPKNRSQVKRVFGRKSFRKQQYVGSLRRHHDFGKRQSVSQRAIPVEKIDPLISAIFMQFLLPCDLMWRSLNRTFDEEEMSDALARARRFRTRAQEFQELAETCGSAQYAKHYYLIAKHYLALAHLDEEKILTAPRETQPTLAPESESDSRLRP